MNSGEARVAVIGNNVAGSSIHGPHSRQLAQEFLDEAKAGVNGHIRPLHLPDALLRDYPDQECTRDPIFLFQRRRYICTGLDSWLEEDYEAGDEGMVCRKKAHCTGDGCDWADGEWSELADLEDGEEELACPKCRRRTVCDEVLTNEELAKLEHCSGLPVMIETWDTELVFFTREEGEAYGKAKHYNYRDGWRVYCVCAHRTLAEVLKYVTRKRESVTH